MSHSEHPDPDVQAALVRLCDALCIWERATTHESVLILREAGGFHFRAMSGKPSIPDFVSDHQLLRGVIPDCGTCATFKDCKRIREGVSMVTPGMDVGRRTIDPALDECYKPSEE